MRTIFTSLLAFTALVLTPVVSAQTPDSGTVTANFNWSSPGSLSPAFSSPDETNRAGEYVGNVTFTDNGITFLVSDEDVKEKSRSARFYFGFNTQTCELRVYAESEIIITAPENMTVTSVTFSGPEADSERFFAYNEGSWNNYTFELQGDATQNNVVKFYTESRIEITNTIVTCTPLNAVTDITADIDTTPAKYYDLSGRSVSVDNLTPGLYVKRQGAHASLQVVQ